MKNETKSKPPIIDDRELINLAVITKERGNRLEIMNGKVYEVSRKLLGELENTNK